METKFVGNISHIAFTDDEAKICPECGGIMVTMCKCANAHMTCENGHTWHIGIKVTRELKPDNRQHVVKYTEYKVLDK